MPSDSWVERQYKRLVERVKRISLEEGLRLGAVAVVQIALRREERAYRNGRAHAVCTRLHADGEPDRRYGIKRRVYCTSNNWV